MDKWSGLKYTSIVPTSVIKTLDRALTVLSNTVGFLTKIIKFLQFFISSFNSFSAVLESFVKFSQKELLQIANDLAGAGVYVNFILPPAFLKGLSKDELFANLASGGYEGFISRLRVSLHNNADKNAPRFSPEAAVGGFIILLDSETLYDFYQGLNFLKGMLNFMDLVPFNTSPEPPRSIKGTCYQAKQPDGTFKPEIVLTWDAPLFKGFDHYKISRSKISGGTRTVSYVAPTKLIGPKGHEEEGWLTATMIKLFGGTNQYPPTITYEYNDPAFNKGSPVEVAANLINKGGSYVDKEIEPGQDNQYYYVIQAGVKPLAGVVGPAFYGPRSNEVMVPTLAKSCISDNLADVVQHGNNKLEYVMTGFLNLGQWSAIPAQNIIPFMPTIINLLNGLTNSLAGAVKTNSRAFSDFLTGVVQKFKTYVNILDTISTMIIGLENFFTGGARVSMLNMPAANGGIDHFMNRVNSAQKPPGGFSGVSGFTMGIVFVYGAGLAGKDANGIIQQDFTQQLKSLDLAFSLISKTLTGK